jgi:hypothetical protein
MKTRFKISILIFAVVIFFTVSAKAATVIGETISTAGLTVIGNSIFEGVSRFSRSLLVTNQIGDEGASLKVDGTYATTSAATIEAVGTTSRLMLISGESVWPTTWSLGINTGLEAEPNQDFQIRQVSDGTGLVNTARLTILKSNGNVGIGTTTPINFFSVANATSSLFDITSSGKVGVGTFDPISFAKMQINYDSASDTVAGLVVSDGGSAHVMLGATSTSGFVGNYNNNSFSIRTNNEDRIFIYDKNAGADVRVGIGTTTPESFFHVYKNTATTTVTVGGVDESGKGSCLKLRDSDGQGWTYCTTLDGTLSCSINSCE